MRIRLTIYFIIIFYNFSLSQNYKDQYCIIKFNNPYGINDKFYVSLFYKINGEVIKPDSSSHRIKINYLGVDTISSSIDSTFQSRSLQYITKFKPFQTYIVYDIPCYGTKINTPSGTRRGKVRFNSTNTSDTLYAIGFKGMPLDTIFPNTKLNYHQYQPQDTCYDLGMEIWFFNESFNNIRFENSKNILTTINFLFIQGEIITATYDANKKDILIDFEGYEK